MPYKKRFSHLFSPSSLRYDERSPYIESMRISIAYEKTTCGRCGGSGSYSYCQMYGTTCFKCAGRKTVITKKGAKAAARYAAIKEAVLSFRVSRVVPGMVIWFESEPSIMGLTRGRRAGWFRVLEVKPAGESQWRSGNGPWNVTQNVTLCTSGRAVTVPVDGLVLRSPSPAALEIMAHHMAGVEGATVTMIDDEPKAVRA